MKRFLKMLLAFILTTCAVISQAQIQSHLHTDITPFSPEPEPGGGGGIKRPALPADKIIVLYQDCNYGGESCSAGPAVIGNTMDGIYVARSSGYPLKQTSAVNVRPGAYIVEVVNTNGVRREVKDFHVDCLSTDFNDAVKAIMVSPAVIFYREAGYRGAQFSYTSGSKLEAMPGADFNDCISSIRLPKGYKVVLYENAGGKGRSITLTADVADLTASGFNDLASSFYVKNPHIIAID